MQNLHFPYSEHKQWVRSTLSSTAPVLLTFNLTDQRQMHFAVNLDPPIKQGQTRYHFLVFNFKMEDEEEIELPYTDEEVKEKFDGKLEREISGPTYEVFEIIFQLNNLQLFSAFFNSSG